MLIVDKITMKFMGLTALNEVSFRVKQGHIHALIGPNGAGKTSLFNIISGVQRPTSGTIHMDGVGDLSAIPLRDRAGIGMMRTFQNIRLFSSMSVLENVMLGATALASTSVFSAALGWGRGRDEEKSVVAEALSLLDRVGLADHAHTQAASLPCGAQRRLEIARALAARPRLLLLDEPVAGMNDVERDTLTTLIRDINDQGVTILIVEHDMPFIKCLSDRVTVLNFGRLVTSGIPDEVTSDPAVIAAYLGTEVEDAHA